jgi:ABC-type amino acid transport system permease subunit
MAEKLAPKKRDWSWRSQAFRGIVYQLIAVGLIGFAGWWLATNTLENMRIRGIQSGFGFLAQPAGFDIGESIHTENSHKYGARDARILLRAGGWTPVAEWTDPDGLFAVYLAEAQAERVAP